MMRKRKKKFLRKEEKKDILSTIAQKRLKKNFKKI